MSIIAGLETPTDGKAETFAVVGLVFQESDSQILGETPREDIAFGPGNLDLSQDEIRERVNNALAETGLAQRADFPARSLSGGEKRRLATAGVLAMDAKIIIFDEPYANMDYHGVLQVNRLIQKLRFQKKTIIILSHETEKCMAMADRFIALNKGKIAFDGGAQQALEQNLEEWGIHHPLKNTAHELKGLVWL
jgi:biotin transport system ATP-binding protein